MIILMELKTFYVFSTYNHRCDKDTYREITNFSSGWDGIKPDITKQTYSSMIKPLGHIINLSFDKGYVHYELKIANVVPI